MKERGSVGGLDEMMLMIMVFPSQTHLARRCVNN